MKITNKLNLPSAFVNAVSREYKYTDKRYSATSLLKPTRELILLRRHNNEIECDCADMVWLVFGNAVHKILEEHDKDGFAEIKLEHTLENGYTISGILDLYNEDKAAVEDYKTSSIYKVLKKDFDDWRRQGWIYGWLARKNGKSCVVAKFHALLKDWSERAKKQARMRKEDYPEYSVYTVHFKFGDKEMETTDKWIRFKIADIAKNEELPDDKLSECTSDERWADPPKFAVYAKRGDKKAKRLFDTKDEAEQFKLLNKCEYVQERQGEDKKCQYYCSVNKFCSYWKQKYEKEEEQNDET